MTNSCFRAVFGYLQFSLFFSCTEANKNFRRLLSENSSFRLSLLDCDMKLPNFTRPLYGVGEHNAKEFPFFFLNLDTALSD